MYKNPNKAELSQLWYFMEENGKIKIISAADHRMVTVADTKDGAKKVMMQTADERTNDRCAAYTKSRKQNHVHRKTSWQVCSVDFQV